MSSKQGKVPGYRLHKLSGQARVTLSGKDFYLGPYGSPESRIKYTKLIQAWEENGRTAPPAVENEDTLRVNDLIDRYLDSVEGLHTGDDPATTNRLARIRLALRPLMEACGTMPAAEFGPVALEKVRQRVIETGVSRTVVNERIWRIKRMVRWAVSREFVPLSLSHGLEALDNLRKGEAGTREGTTVRPVSWEGVEATLPHVSRQVAAMVLFQWWTGCRPGEVVRLRPSDLEQSGEVWVYRPERHKTEHHGKAREIAVGPKAQQVLRPFLCRVPPPPPDKPLFSPQDAEQERRLELRAKRRSKPTPSQAQRSRKDDPKRAAGECYDVPSYRRAIDRGVQAANAERVRGALMEVLVSELPEAAHRFFERALGTLPADTTDQHVAAAIQRAARNVSSRKRLSLSIDPDPLIERASLCLKAFKPIQRWHPHQLRHSAATRLRKELGVEAARVVLGHSSAAITEVYAEIDREKAMGAMAELG